MGKPSSSSEIHVHSVVCVDLPKANHGEVNGISGHGQIEKISNTFIIQNKENRTKLDDMRKSVYGLQLWIAMLVFALAVVLGYVIFLTIHIQELKELKVCQQNSTVQGVTGN